ncbi:MAG: hypothetical protein ACI9CV_001462 [Ilumatobacter sp.]
MIHPSETTSTPLWAMAATLDSVTLPEASVRALPPTRPTASCSSSPRRLSSRMTSAPRRTDSGGHRTSSRSVVVLDHHRVVEAEAMVDAATTADRVLFE